MPSLEELVKLFAERARRQLMEEVERQKNKDTSTAKWEGYDADGNPIVKDGDQTKTVKGLGNTGMVKGTKLILDDVGSVEYKRRAKKEEDKKVTKRQRRVAQPTRLVVRDNLISVAAAFEEEIYYLTEEEELPAFEIPDGGFYVCTYSTLRASVEAVGQAAVSTPRIAGLASYSVSDTLNVLNYTDQATGGTTWRVSAGAVAAASRSTAGENGTASASVGGVGISVSVNVSGAQGAADAQVETSETTGGGSFDYELDGSNIALAVNILGGSATADAECAHITFPRAVWYYQILNDPEDATLTRIRQIDLNSVVPNQVYESKLIHNFAVREGDEAFVYSIWYVIDVDMTQTQSITDINDGDQRDIEMLIGRQTRYIVHARLNINTGNIVTKATESPDTGSFSLVSGDAIEYPDGQAPNGLWLVRARAVGIASGGVATEQAVARIDVSNDTIENDLDRDFFNPEAVWAESYDGDWINAYSDVTWDSTASANISDAELADFLLSSYKQGNFYRGWDSLMPTDLVTPEFIEWDPTGDPFDGNARPDGDWRDIENLQNAIELSGTSIEYANYFDGSQANTPDDFDQWRTWTGLRSATSGEVERLGPDFATPDNVNETGLPRGDRLRNHVWFSYIPPSA